MTDLTELEQAALVAVVEATAGVGGWIEVSGAHSVGAGGIVPVLGIRVTWWRPDLATVAWTKGTYSHPGPAILEAAEALGVAKRSKAAT